MTKRLLLAMLLCAMAVPCAWAADGKSETVARDKALTNLLGSVESLKMNETQTVGDYLKVTTLQPQQYKAALLKGAEELPPTEYLEDGRAQVTVRILPAVLVENLKQVVQGQVLAKTVLDTSALDALSVPAELGPGLVTSQSLFPTATGVSSPAPLQSVPGWAGVTERQRLDVGAAAHADAVTRLIALSDNMMVDKTMTLKALAEKTPAVRAAVDKFLRGVRPASRTYYADGIVAVKVATAGADLWNALAVALKPAKPEEKAPVDLKELEYAAARDAGSKMIVTGYARLDGKAVDAAQLTASPKTIEVPADEPPASTLEVR